MPPVPPESVHIWPPWKFQVTLQPTPPRSELSILTLGGQQAGKCGLFAEHAVGSHELGSVTE